MKKDEVLSTMPLLTVNPSELENKKLTVEKAMRYLHTMFCTFINRCTIIALPMTEILVTTAQKKSDSQFGLNK